MDIQELKTEIDIAEDGADFVREVSLFYPGISALVPSEPLENCGEMLMKDGSLIMLREVSVDAYLNPTGLVTEDGRVGAIKKLDSGQTVVVWR